eukprot:1160573-Pelagomonas_calceolata.AAC.7
MLMVQDYSSAARPVVGGRASIGAAPKLKCFEGCKVVKGHIVSMAPEGFGRWWLQRLHVAGPLVPPLADAGPEKFRKDLHASSPGLSLQVLDLRSEIADLRSKLEDSKGQLQSNEQMIRWLNQQMTTWHKQQRCGDDQMAGPASAGDQMAEPTMYDWSWSIRLILF